MKVGVVDQKIESICISRDFLEGDGNFILSFMKM